MQTVTLFKKTRENGTENIYPDEFIGGMRPLILSTVGLAALLLAVGVVISGQNQWTAMMYVIIALGQAFVGVTGYLRLRDKTEVKSAANVVVQHSWAFISMSIATIALAPSEFFLVDTLWVATAIVVGLLWAIVGVVGIYLSVVGGGSRLTV